MARKRALAKVTAKAEAAKTEIQEAAKEVKAATEEKKETVKEAVKDVVEEKKEAVKEAVKTAVEKEEKTVKKPAKKAVKKEIKVKTYVQYFGKEVEEKEMIAAVKKDWTKVSGKKVGDIKEISLYVKPEEGFVYYVVNGTDSGKVEF